MFESLLSLLSVVYPEEELPYYLVTLISSGTTILFGSGPIATKGTQEFQFLHDSDESPTHVLFVIAVACAFGVLSNKLLPNQI